MMSIEWMLCIWSICMAMHCAYKFRVEFKKLANIRGEGYMSCSYVCTVPDCIVY